MGAIYHESLATTLNSKAPGGDGISYRTLKQLPIQAFDKLAQIYNACMEVGHWPAHFKKAIVIPVKKQDKSDLNLYLKNWWLKELKCICE